MIEFSINSVLFTINYRNNSCLINDSPTFEQDQIRSVEFAPGFLSSSLDKFPLKIQGIRRRLNFIQPGFEPSLNQRAFLHSSPTYRSVGLPLNEVKLNLKVIGMLTENTYFFDKFLIVFYKIILTNKKGSGLCYLKAELNVMNY
jgi:hypothetical protein